MSGRNISKVWQNALRPIMSLPYTKLLVGIFRRKRTQVLLILVLGYLSARRKYRNAARAASIKAEKMPRLRFVQGITVKDSNTSESLESPVVRTRKGEILGRFTPKSTRKGDEHGSVYTFRGIPYAAPPTGKRRFKHPEAHDNWDGVLDCTRFSRIAPQANIMPEDLVKPIPELVRKVACDVFLGWGLNFIVSDPQPIPPHQSEDCLYLNVDSTSLDPNAKLPVAVWIHGGGFAMGGSSEAMYSHAWGHSLAANENVVIVSINYRLGALGFLKVPNGDYNCALADMIQALKWVRDEISSFGGDPDNVTVFGESAGAMSIGCLLSSPKANRYFNRAILQSGACYNSVFEDHSRFLMKLFKRQLGENVDMQEVPAASILAVQSKVRFLSSAGVLPFQPVVDGDLLPFPPMEAIERGIGSHVDVIVGYNRHEWRLFAGVFHPILRLVPTKVLQLLFAHVTGPALASSRLESNEELPKEIFDRYKEEYDRLSEHMQRITGKPRNPEVDWAALYNTVQSDMTFRAPAILLAHTHAKVKQPNVATYMYRFDYGTACHGLELLFIHGTANRTDIGAHKFVLPDWFQQERTEQELEQDMQVVSQLSRDMQESWGNFFRCGDPSVPRLKLNWRQVEPQGGETMVFNSHRRYKLLVGDAHKYTCHDVYQSGSELALSQMCKSSGYRARGGRALPSTPSFAAKLEQLQERYRKAADHSSETVESKEEGEPKNIKGLFKSTPVYSSDEGHAFDYLCEIRKSNDHGFGAGFGHSSTKNA